MDLVSFSNNGTEPHLIDLMRSSQFNARTTKHLALAWTRNIVPTTVEISMLLTYYIAAFLPS